MTKTITLSDTAYFDLVEILVESEKSINERLPEMKIFWECDPAAQMDMKMREKQLRKLSELEQTAKKYNRVIEELRNNGSV